MLRYYQLSLMYNSRLISVRCSYTQNNPATSDPLIPSYVVWGYCERKSLALNLKGSIIPSANVSAHLLTPVTTALGSALYLYHLLNGIRDMLRNLELTKDSSGKIHLHNFEAYKWSPCKLYMRGFCTYRCKACSVSLEYSYQVIPNSSCASSSFL